MVGCPPHREMSRGCIRILARPVFGVRGLAVGKGVGAVPGPGGGKWGEGKQLLYNPFPEARGPTWASLIQQKRKPSQSKDAKYKQHSPSNLLIRAH